MSKRMMLISIAVIVVGCVSVAVGLTGAAEHAHVAVSEPGENAGDSGGVVSYAELSPAAQVTFRDAVVSDGYVSVPKRDVMELRDVGLVRLDGTVYAVSVETGKYPMWAKAAGVIGVGVVVAGLLVFGAELRLVDEELYNVVVGVVALLFAVGVVGVAGYGFVTSVGVDESRISTTPVSVAGDVPGSEVVRVESLSAAQREAVYETVQGGEGVAASVVSYRLVRELGPSVSREYTYVKSDSEYYKLQAVRSYLSFLEVLWVSMVVGAVGCVLGLKGGVLVRESAYYPGRFAG